MNRFEFSFDRTNEKSREKREDDISNARERTSEKKKGSGCVYKRKDGRGRENTPGISVARKSFLQRVLHYPRQEIREKFEHPLR